ncbi:MAG TPA: DUF1015 domain-containing protein [Deltaproteobacteria bacterium]|nr:DUF1015 domain-containing protein [Deltaproteobacteria bacterium]
MPKIRSFKGVRYDPRKVDLADVICPPYDVTSPQQVEEFYAKSPYNAVRLVLGKQFTKDTKENNRYTRARNFYRQWINAAVLIQDELPALYYHEHTYPFSDRVHARRGFIASVRLDNDEKKTIRPHEYTQQGPKIDRLRLMSETRTNFSSVFGVYSDPKKTLEQIIRQNISDPLVEFSAAQESHRIWKIEEQGLIDKVGRMMQQKKILIADGHHRYETAKIYRDRMRAATGKKDGNQSFDYIQMYLVNMDEGIRILPTHRVILNSMGVGLVDLEYRIKEMFNMVPFDNRKALLSALGKAGRGNIGLFVRGIPRYYLLQVIDYADVERYLPASTHPLLKKLDVTILQECIIDPVIGISGSLGAQRIEYPHRAEEALDMVAREQADIAFLLNPTSIQEIIEIAEAGLRMPQKSTFFYPKVPTGLVFHPLE